MPSDIDPTVWLTAPLAPEAIGPSKHDPSAWHYTNAVGINGIVSTGLLWACSTDGLNDSQEVQFGIGAFRRLWELVKPALIDEAPVAAVEEWLADIERRAAAREVLVVCASENGDSLLHWQTYARINDGYAIELSPTVEYKVFASEGQPALFQPDDVPAIFWRSVTYGDKDPEWGWEQWDPTRRMLEGALDAFGSLERGQIANEGFMRDLLDRQYVALVYAYKHEGFADEREKRLIVVRPPIDGFTADRDSHYGPSHKVFLAAVDEPDPERYTVDRIARLPILSVQLAPRNPEGDEERLRDLLDAAGYSGVPITRSRTPIR
ncbi:hypothetical protein [Leifsonia sp. NCR5]|uniref:hypothetical protein n=1 Tax=Leifsonia sp. NCR5 TaxID=1978342 RepID=UPI00117ACABF|nr:hypothetical protein [Leifsonia sp. NCR5]